MEFGEVILKRTSIRNYKPDPIPKDKLEFILECARQSPSWANTQCWRFIIIQDSETIKSIAKASLINRWLKNVPCIIIACADTTSSGTKNNINYFTVDVAIALEHLVLGATDVGLGTCWIGGFDESKIKDLIGIPNRVKIVAMTPLGFPAEKTSSSQKIKKALIKSSKRRSQAEIVHYEKW